MRLGTSFLLKLKLILNINYLEVLLNIVRMLTMNYSKTTKKEKHKQLQIDQVFKKIKYSKLTNNAYQEKSLCKLKEHFITNNTKYQSYAAQSINKYIAGLKSKNKSSKFIHFINTLIEADFMEIISQVMATLDTTLLKLLFTLLNYMKSSPKFYEFHRLGPITDSLLRTLNVFLKQYRRRRVTEEGLKLLVSILNKPNQKYFIRHIFKENLLLNFIKKMFIEGYGKHNTKCYPDILVHSILMCCDFTDSELVDDVVSIAQLSMRSLHKKIKHEDYDFNQKAMYIALSCDIISLVLLRLVKEKSENSLIPTIKQELKFLSEFIFKRNAHNLTGKLCRCLMSAYETLEVEHMKEVSEYLNKQGVFKFLVAENTVFRSKNKVNTQKVIIQLLVKQLTLLCQMVLTSDTRWEKIFTYGFNKLPPDVRSWASHIKSKEHLDKLQVTVFSFCYMHYVALPTCFESKFSQLDQLMVIIPKTLIYMNHNIDFVYIKIILFLFAVSFLLNYKDKWTTIKSCMKPLHQLRRYKDSTSICEKIYTEHRDFITWIVSNGAKQIPLKMKFDFVARWITSDKTNNMVLELEAEKGNDVASLLLIFFIQCSESMVLPLYNILRNILLKQKLLPKNEKHVRNLVWANLIRMFNQYKNNESLAFNLICYIYLAIEDPLKFTEHNFYSIVSLILTTLSTHSVYDKVELHIAILLFITVITSQLKDTKEKKGLNVLLSHKDFLNFIRSGLYVDNNHVFALSVNIISFLNTIRNSSGIVPTVFISIKANDLNSLMSKDISNALQCVDLFIMAIPSIGLKPFFSITSFSTEIVTQIYFNLISMNMTKHCKIDQCWKSMSYILDNHKDSHSFALLPWSPNLISYTINGTDLTLNDRPWLSFLKSWLAALQPSAGCWPIMGLWSRNIITDTIREVSYELIAASYSVSDMQFVQMAELILNLRIRLPNEVMTVLEEIASKH